MLPIPYIVLAIEDESDREFMEHIFISYQRLMYYEINNIVKDPWRTEDILQTTIIRLINNIDTLRTLSTPKLVNYIISASKNTALTQIRNDNRKRTTSFPDWFDVPQDEESDSNPEYFVLRKEDGVTLAEVWPRLDDRSKFFLRERYILNKSDAELANELQIKPGSVRMALTRARRAAYLLIMSEE